MFRLIDYTPEILKMAEANNTQWDVAASMFLNNIRDVHVEDDQYVYHGAGLPKSEYAKLHKVLDNEARYDGEYMNEFRELYDSHIDEFTALWNKGDIAGIRALAKTL